jgi:hypothetical protein
MIAAAAGLIDSMFTGLPLARSTVFVVADRLRHFRSGWATRLVAAPDWNTALTARTS